MNPELHAALRERFRRRKMKNFFKTYGPFLILGGVFFPLLFLAISKNISDNRYRQENTVRSGAILGGVPVEQLTVRTYTVTRVIYLDSDGREVFRTESALEIK